MYQDVLTRHISPNKSEIISILLILSTQFHSSYLRFLLSIFPISPSKSFVYVVFFCMVVGILAHFEVIHFAVIIGIEDFLFSGC